MVSQFSQSAVAQVAPAASISTASSTKSTGPIRLTIVCCVLLSVAIVTGAGLFLFSLRNRVLAENERHLSNTALILAKQIEHSFTTAESVQKGIIQQTADFGIIDTADREHQLSRYDFHLKLRDNAAGMPHVGGLTIINAQGRVINFSRQWPIPDIDVTDRDFFKALQSDPNLTSFMSEPVRNRATGTWVIHLARKISRPNGEFVGLISAAIELELLQNIFKGITLDADSAITLFRRDGVLVARFPELSSNIGRRFPDAIGLKLVSTTDQGVGITRGLIGGHSRMVAAHRVGIYPIVVTATRTMAAVLADWQRTVAYIIGISALTIVTIAAFAFLFIRLFRNYQALVKARAEQEKAEQLREQSLRFDVALNNMTQGLLMFDASARIVVCNERYLQMYGLSSEVVKLGWTLFELIKHRVETGSFNGDPHEYCSQILDQVAKRQLTSQSVEIPDGRTIHIANQPMVNGGWVATHEDITDKVHAEKRISYLAHNDSLTDLPNRAAFIEHFDATLAKASKAGEQFSILSMDLDRFKEANDVYGHVIGDALLREVARRLKATAEGAFLARLGGDEFVLIVTDGPQSAAAEALAERLLAAFKDDFEVDGHRLKLGLSIGGAVFPTDGTDTKTLMINADASLYRAKAELRGSVRFFEAEMGERLRERRNLQHDLRSAVGRGELFLHYQPQKTMAGETIGFEALARWQCPKRGVVVPETFIRIAEESDLILSVGEWVLREACREAASWPQPLKIAVNISPIQFRHGNLPNLVHSILLETGLAPARLELEITEGVLIDDFSRAVSILRKLKSLGVQIAMDDFGSGYSSMSYLHAFPFDKIKIDRTFIGDLEHNRHSMAIVHAIIGLGHSLDVPILAEGVETEAQHVFLVQEGCDEVQGYLTGRPFPIEDYAELVGRPAIAKQTYLVAAG